MRLLCRLSSGHGLLPHLSPLLLVLALLSIPRFVHSKKFMQHLSVVDLLARVVETPRFGLTDGYRSP